MMSIIPDLQQAKDFVDKGTNTTNMFIGSVVSGIISSMNSGARSASVAIAGQVASDVRYLLQQLNVKGYKAALESGNLTVRW